MDETWRYKFKEARKKLGLTRREVAVRSGVSLESVRAYEGGQRNPTKARLIQLLHAIEATTYDAKEILEAAGYSTPASMFPEEEYPDYFFSIEQLQSEVELVQWPEFVLNNANEVVAANAAVQTLWGIDFACERATRTRAQLNVLSVASQHRFAERIVNWDECVGVLAAVFKGRPVNPASLDEPDPYLSEVLQEFAAGDPAFVARLAKVWTSTPGRDAKVRWSYPVVWDDPELGTMRFHAIVGTASEPGGLSFNDWIPLDGETWNVLRSVRARIA